jgi:hypothetical protein
MSNNITYSVVITKTKEDGTKDLYVKNIEIDKIGITDNDTFKHYSVNNNKQIDNVSYSNIKNSTQTNTSVMSKGKEFLNKGIKIFNKKMI